MAADQDYWESPEGRIEAMGRVVSYMDALQSRTDEGTVGLEVSKAMLERLALELGLDGWRHVEHTIADAVREEDLLRYFHWPAKILTTEGEIETGSRNSILWMNALDVIDKSDPRES